MSHEGRDRSAGRCGQTPSAVALGAREGYTSESEETYR